MSYSTLDIITDVETNGAGIPGADAATEFARMSALTETVKTDIPSSSITRYLMLVDKWFPIKNGVDAASLAATEALNIFDAFQLTDPDFGALVEGKLSDVMDALIEEGKINATDKATILSFGNQEIPLWPNLTLAKVEKAIDYRTEGKV